MSRSAISRPHGLDRRAFLTRAAVSAIVITNGALICLGEAWGLEVKALKPETARTLVKLARDIYPHDRLADRFYAVAVKGYDEKAAKEPAMLAEVEGGVAALDAAAKAEYGVAYVNVGWEGQRVALLRPIQHGPFFQS